MAAYTDYVFPPHSYSPSYQGVSRYGWQTAGNVITLLAAWIAAGLYGNIGAWLLTVLHFMEKAWLSLKQ